MVLEIFWIQILTCTKISFSTEQTVLVLFCVHYSKIHVVMHVMRELLLH